MTPSLSRGSKASGSTSRRRNTSVSFHKRGNRKVGETHTLADGRQLYFVYRNLWQVFRFEEKDISAAVRSGRAGWAVSEEDLINCSAKGIVAIGILVRENGDRYLTSIERFNSERSTSVEVGKMHRIRQRYLPMTEFRKSAGIVKI
jgi:hypothetical protein